MMSMKMLRAQLERMKVRDAMHLPPGMMRPDASRVSRAGFAHAYRMGVHWTTLTMDVLTV
jgi:hypothetical protein